MERLCKNCIFFKRDGTSHLGECDAVQNSKEYINYTNENGDIGIKSVDISQAVSNKIIWFDGGNYDSMMVGENFMCIQFDEK